MATIGLLGAGAFSNFTLGAYRRYNPEFELASIASRTRSKAEAIAEEFGFAKVHDSNEELMRDPDVDIVLILTPPQTHYKLAMECLSHGKHVLVDKPVAYTATEAEDIVKTSRKNDLQLSTNLVLRVHPVHKRIHDITRDKEMGELIQILSSGQLARYPQDHWYWDATVSGGFFLNTFSHFIDLYNYIIGEQPVLVKSFGNTRNGYTLVGSYPSGVNTTLTSSLQVSNENERVNTTYVYERGVIETRGWVPEMVEVRPDDGYKDTRYAEDRDDEYAHCLARIMAELVQRVDHPHEPVDVEITWDVFLNSVALPLRYEANVI